MKTRNCPKCWEPCEIGKPHTCPPKPAAALRIPRPAEIVNAIAPELKSVVNIAASPHSVTNSVTNDGDKARVYRWREKHRAAYNAKQRDIMRRKRAEAKAEAAA